MLPTAPTRIVPRESTQRVNFLARLFGFALQENGVRQQRLADRGQVHAS
jgi:hypothetical protein